MKSFGLIPEIIGRLPVLTYLNPLDRAALRSILTEPKNSIIKQYIKQFFRRPTDHAAAIIEDVPNFVKLYPDISIPALADLQLRIQRQIVLENLQNLFKGQHLALNSFTGLLYYLPLLSGKRR